MTIYHILGISAYVMDTQGKTVYDKEIQINILLGIFMVHDGNNNFNRLVYSVKSKYEDKNEYEGQGKRKNHRVTMRTSKGKNTRKFNADGKKSQKSDKT